MSNATKTLAAIFLLLLGLTAVMELFSNPGSSEAFRSQLVTLNPAEVDYIEIDSPNRAYPVTLKRDGEGWSVAENETGERYPANNQMIERAIEEMNSLNVKSVVTRDPSKYSRFKVDTTGTTVRFYQGKESVGEIVLGAPQFISRQEFNTYVRPAGSDAVYSVEGFISSTYQRDLSGWRDKTVWNVDRSSITQIDYSYPADSSFSMVKAEANTWVTGSDTLKQTEVDRIVSRLSKLTATNFMEGVTGEAELTDPLYTVTVQLDNGVQKSVKLTPSEADDTEFEASAGGYPYRFLLNKSSWERTVLRSREELLDDE